MNARSLLISFQIFFTPNVHTIFLVLRFRFETSPFHKSPFYKWYNTVSTHLYAIAQSLQLLFTAIHTMYFCIWQNFETFLKRSDRNVDCKTVNEKISTILTIAFAMSMSFMHFFVYLYTYADQYFFHYISKKQCR